MPSYVTTVTLPATPTGGVLVDAGATEVTSMLSVVDQAAADAAVAAHAVRFDTAQTLTSGQATQARANMGLGSIATADANSYLPQLPTAGTYTYNTDGTVATDPDGNSYTYNSDGTVHTITKGGVTRTATYNGDGTVGSWS